ncbi:hypothetical protein HYW83_04850 [Candidatus Peregrinibacteria bacterium]|nr:hypothetical protein [Candidatus Peregrinibacteria bacterium]
MGLPEDGAEATEPTPAIAAAPSTTTGTPPKPEATEVVPEMSLTVAGACNNPHGNYVGLNKGQRDKLQVEIGSSVELMDGAGQSLGIFTVGTGSKNLLLESEKFTANGVGVGATVTVKRAVKKSEREINLSASYGIEAAEQHERRAGIIRNRFPDMDPEDYITVPTALGRELGFSPNPAAKATVLSISKGRVRIGGIDHEIVMVPSGSTIGFTTKAAQRLGIPKELGTIKVRIDNGVLVI